MVTKITKAILFRKHFYYFFILFIFSVMLSLSRDNFFFFFFDYINSHNISLSSLKFSFSLDFIVVSYSTILFLVVSLVFLYREYYIESYNVKKFVYLTFGFSLSIIVLYTRGRLISLIVGWDFLGLTSIFLIIFYPNKNTSYNSFLTIFFNRLGDSILVVLFSIIILFKSELLHFNVFLSNQILFLFLIICSLTKRAQYPLSSWLPAAMSAPTPISAMVHSSTLVTAGILLNSKLIRIFQFSAFYIFLIITRIVSFVSGGLIGSFELDLKKVVAFSTMSQISIIIFICSINLLFLCMFHIFLHALFKTLLFCHCGSIFINNFSDQRSKNMGRNFSLIFSRVGVLVSLFSISGLCYSSSFYSKDLILEFCCTSFSYLGYNLLILGRVLTLFYCSKISLYRSTHGSLVFTETRKNFYFFFLKIFMAVTLISGSLFFYNFEIEWACTVYYWDIYFILFIFIIPFFFFLPYVKNLFILSLDISFIKSISYSFFSKILLKTEIMKFISFNDTMIFKPLFIIDLTINKCKIFYCFLFFFLLSFSLYSFSLIWT